MNNYVTPVVLAAAVGMCVIARPVRQIVLTSGRSIVPAADGELRLPIGSADPEDAVDALRGLLRPRGLPCDVESEADARSARFHALVDREFLGTLTPDEEHELAILTRWHDDQKAAFYREIMRG
jgi:hypothetical protein